MFTNYIDEISFGESFRLNHLKLFSYLLEIKVRLKERKRHRNLYNHSDTYILLSDKFRKTFFDVTGLNNGEKLISIPNPLVEIDIQDVREREKTIIFVGRIDYSHKRVDRLLEIFGKTNGVKDGWKLLIIGDGPYRKELESRVHKEKLEGISFEGFQVDVTNYYNTASIICLTSNVEGWGMVLTEAMQYGVIPLSFNSYESIYDIIDHDVNGFIIPSFNLDDYSNKLKLLMNNKCLREKFSENAKVKATNFYTNKIVSQWNILLNKPSGSYSDKNDIDRF
jgi:glycosyltransferase involved in cell wall biosynthesis